MKKAALTSKVIKQELKKAFPEIKFSVKSRNFAGGNAVDICWTDGPTREMIKNIISKYQYGHFDGMIDLYKDSNVRDDIPQVKYVQTHRSMSNDVETDIKKHIKDYYGIDIIIGNEWVDGHKCYGDTLIYREFIKLDLTK